LTRKLSVFRYSKMSAEAGEGASDKPEEPPKLTPAEFREFNKLAELMDSYHNHFRHQWTMLHDACTQNKRPGNLSIRQFLLSGLNFCSVLTLHHDIEEAHVFPRLAQKMPIFRANERMKNHHKQIHSGLVTFEKYLNECRNGEKELRLNEMKEVMDSFGDVLWEHLDEEVQQLGAENMRKFWTLDEVKTLIF